jgi:hypothetical protein
MLPKLYSGSHVTIEFVLASIRSAFDEECSALRLEHGATVTSHARIDASTILTVHGERDIALALASIPAGSKVRAVANTAFGTYNEVIWSEDGDPFPKLMVKKGWLLPKY